jgi:hypothetical protein
VDAFTPYVGPLLGLLGTVLVASIGLYQWRKQQSNPNRAAVADARRKAAETLWSKLEEINIVLREEHATSKETLRALQKEANSTFLKNSLYLDDTTQQLVKSYVESLSRVASMIQDQGSAAAEEWENTNIMPAVSASPKLAAALGDAASRRELVKNALLKSTGA